MDKLSRYIDPSQLTREFCGFLYYDHQQWIRNRISFEQYLAEAERRLDSIQHTDSMAKMSEEVMHLAFYSIAAFFKNGSFPSLSST